MQHHHLNLESGSSGGQVYTHENASVTIDEVADSIKFEDDRHLGQANIVDQEAVDLDNITNRELEARIREMKLQIRNM